MLRLDINLLFTAANLLIWFFLIRKFLFKPINNVISKREEAIASQYAKAQKLQEEAAAEKENVQNSRFRSSRKSCCSHRSTKESQDRV